MQRLALGLLAAAALLYVLATTLEARHPAWGYVAAFAEAAMVGAVADWFAVVALFRHPLGLPIPHTAIIPANKDRIGQNLADFIATHFLATDQVLGKIKEFDAAGRVAQWLARPENAERIGERLVEVSRWAVGTLNDERVRLFVSDLARRGLKQVDVTRLTGQVLEAMTHERRHQALLDGVLVQLARLLGEDVVQDSLTEAIAREVKALRYVGLDQMAARLATRKVVVIVAKTIVDMAEDPQHDLRLRFDEAVSQFVARLKTDGDLYSRVEKAKGELLDNPAMNDYVNQLWSELLAWLQDDMARGDSSLRHSITLAARTLGERLTRDTEVRTWINGELQAVAPRLIERYREDIRNYIVARVQSWDAREMTDELESHIGRDLQFIRINGTLVGGLVGLVIHSLTVWLK
jgi:uncharacterized membrane-anchored protein YjiN (DUF445 family)